VPDRPTTAAPDAGARRRYRIAVLRGDGIGPEIMTEAEETLSAAAAAAGDFDVELERFTAGAVHYLSTGVPMDEEVAERLSEFDAILAGPFGDPRVPDALVVWGTILKLRQRFDQYVNLRPALSLPGVPSPLRSVGPGDLDIVVVRENTEGEYAGAGGRVHRGRPAEVAVETSVFTRAGVERIVRYAFEYAREHDRRLVTSATKSNALRHAMPFWDDVVAEVARDFPDLEHESALVDALVARVVTDPGSLDVVVASNLFGDILTDLTAAAAGGLGVGPSANLNPTRTHPSLFQAIHGSAPDIAGQGVANPLGEILSVALMLEFLGEREAAGAIERAVAATTERPETRTRDLGGRASTRVAGEAVRTVLAAELPAAASDNR
jgi:tartrate dehydrogenase/decarboxylase/D-malate dehydrogenase